MRAISSCFLLASFAFACGSFGEGSPPAAQPDAGSGAGDADATSAPQTTCPGRKDAYICEDFERPKALDDWTLSGVGSATLVNAPARGTQALSAHVPATTGSNAAQINRGFDHPFPLHVRFFAYLEEPLADSAYHFVFVLDGNEIGIQNDRMVVVQFVQPDIYETSTATLTPKKWTCVEWTIEANATTLSFDGTPQVTVTGKAMAPAKSNVHIGLGINATSNVARTLYLDDIVVAPTPVGCN